MPEGLLQVGRVGRPHGIRGDLFISLTSDRDERVAVGSRLWIDGEWRTVTASAASNGRWRVHLDGIDVREAAAALTGQDIFAEPIEDPDTLWIHDLIGATVIETDGTERGVCVSVVANPASDLLELDSGALVPATFVVSSDTGADAERPTITIDPPAGLFELYDT